MSEEKETRVKKYKNRRTEETEIKEIKKEEPKKEKIKQKKEVIKEEKTEREQKEHPLLNKILLTILVLFIVTASYSTLIEPKLITVKEYKIESKNIPDSFHGLKIVHLTDIHYGTTINKNQLRKIIEKVNELKPDIIVFTGDLQDKDVTLTETTEEELITYLSALECSLYKYAIYGDEDLNNSKYSEIMTKSNFILLDNKTTPIYYKDTTPILITGYNPIISNPNYTILTDFVDNQDPTNYYKIVLSHEPDSLDKFVNYNPNLVLSGHSLGGTIDLKFTKPSFLPENSTKYYEDYQKIKNTDMYISNGLGTKSLNIRLLNPPSINLYRLYKIK